MSVCVKIERGISTQKIVWWSQNFDMSPFSQGTNAKRAENTILMPFFAPQNLVTLTS